MGMRVPYSIQGALFGPVLIVLTVILKVSCQPGNTHCFADYFSVPIFLPLILVYKTFGRDMISHELWFVVLYWSLVGFLAGLIFDLHTRPSPNLPEQHPPL
jgi:hypothetical protein